MECIKLNDLLNIDETSDDFLNGRITFSTGRLSEYLSLFSKGQVENGCDFSYYPNDNAGRRKLHLGDLVVEAVQLDKRDEWLLIAITRVIDIPDFQHPCTREAIDTYKKWAGRVIFRCKDKRASGFKFTLPTFLDRCEVISVLERPYGGKPFPGYDGIKNIQFSELTTYLNGNFYEALDWQNHLSAVYGIYCLYNDDENMFYIGSAYNEGGLNKRWQDYLTSFHGDDKKLKELRKVHLEDEYFMNHFYFTILEILPKGMDLNEVIRREENWKSVFNSIKRGYNSN